MATQWDEWVARDRIIAEEQLQPEPTRTFMANAFRDGSVPTSGTAITTILPPVSRFSRDNSRSTKKQTVLDKLVAYLARFDRLG